MIGLAVLAIAPVSELAIELCWQDAWLSTACLIAFKNTQRCTTTRTLVRSHTRSCSEHFARAMPIPGARTAPFLHRCEAESRRPPSSPETQKISQDRVQTFTDPSSTCPELCLVWSSRASPRLSPSPGPNCGAQTRAHKRYSCVGALISRLRHPLAHCRARNGSTGP